MKTKNRKKPNWMIGSFRILLFSLCVGGISGLTLPQRANAQEVEKWSFELPISIGLSYRYAPNLLESSEGLDALFNFLFAFRAETVLDFMAVSPNGKHYVGGALGFGVIQASTTAGEFEQEYTLFDIPLLFVYRYQIGSFGIRPYIGTILEGAITTFTLGGETVDAEGDEFIADLTIGVRMQFGKAVSSGYIEAAYIYSPDNPRYPEDEHSGKFVVGWTMDIMKTARGGE